MALTRTVINGIPVYVDEALMPGTIILLDRGTGKASVLMNGRLASNVDMGEAAAEIVLETERRIREFLR